MSLYPDYDTIYKDRDVSHAIVGALAIGKVAASDMTFETR